jgi:hypothetical protein
MLRGLLLFFIFTSFTGAEGVRYNGCYKSFSDDHSLTGLYYVRLYPDGSAIEYEQPGNVRINFDKKTLARILRKESENEKFSLKKGKFFIKESAIKITLTLNGETVTYDGVINKFTLQLERFSTRTNERKPVDMSFMKIGSFQ